LQRTLNGWEEVSDAVARDKVSHSFRTKPTRLVIKPETTTSMAPEAPASSKRVRRKEELMNEKDEVEVSEEIEKGH
jgi:hypothetical protein